MEILSNIGIRVIFDQDGEIVSIISEMSGSVLPRKKLIDLYCLDLEYGAINNRTHRLVGINMETKQPEIPNIESEEQQRIRELEDELLLQADKELGGIL